LCTSAGIATEGEMMEIQASMRGLRNTEFWGRSDGRQRRRHSDGFYGSIVRSNGLYSIGPLLQVCSQMSFDIVLFRKLLTTFRRGFLPPSSDRGSATRSYNPEDHTFIFQGSVNVRSHPDHKPSLDPLVNQLLQVDAQLSSVQR